jgi:hypothetical protein
MFSRETLTAAALASSLTLRQAGDFARRRRGAAASKPAAVTE